MNKKFKLTIDSIYNRLEKIEEIGKYRCKSVILNVGNDKNRFSFFDTFENQEKTDVKRYNINEMQILSVLIKTPINVVDVNTIEIENPKLLNEGLEINKTSNYIQMKFIFSLDAEQEYTRILRPLKDIINAQVFEKLLVDNGLIEVNNIRESFWTYDAQENKRKAQNIVACFYQEPGFTKNNTKELRTRDNFYSLEKNKNLGIESAISNKIYLFDQEFFERFELFQYQDFYNLQKHEKMQKIFKEIERILGMTPNKEEYIKIRSQFKDMSRFVQSAYFAFLAFENNSEKTFFNKYELIQKIIVLNESDYLVELLSEKVHEILLKFSGFVESRDKYIPGRGNFLNATIYNEFLIYCGVIE